MQRTEVEVHGAPDAVPAARRATVAALRSVVDDAVVAAAELVVSELVTNALLHAGAPVRLTVDADAEAGAARVEVRDGSRAVPVQPRVDGGGMTGRGLSLVDAVAEAWGVEPTPDGKVVWAALTPESVVEAEPCEGDLEGVLASFDDWPEPPGASQRVTVTLGDVPTDLLLAAKAHVDSMVRELTLTATGAASGMSGALPAHLAELVHGVVSEFAEARQSIKVQALAAAERGAERTNLTLTLPPEAADAGERYLAALQESDAYARAVRLLTLSAPPQHRAFRRWYVTSLVAGLRRAAAGEPPVPPPSFESFLLTEVDALAGLQQVSDRAARLQRVTAALAGLLDRDQVAATALDEAVAELGALRGAVVLGEGATVHLVRTVGYDDRLLQVLTDSWSDGAETPVRTGLRTGQPVWIESRAERDEAFPQVGPLEPDVVASCVVPLRVAEHSIGVLRLAFAESRLFTADERAFLVALAAVAAQAFERADLYAVQAATADRLARLQAVTTALAATHTVDEVLDVTVSHGRDLIGAQVASVSLLAADGRTVDLVRVEPPLVGADTRWRSFDLDDALPAAEAIRTGDLVQASTVAERDARWPALASLRFRAEHALIVLPLHVEGATIGALTLSFGDRVEPGEHQPSREFLLAFADACAQALERARAAERAEVAGLRLAFLARASAELTDTLVAERTISRIARLLVPELADWAVVHLLQDGELAALAVEHVDPDKTALAWAAQRRWPARLVGSDGVGAVVRTGVPQLVSSITPEVLAAAGQDPEHAAVLRELGLVSALIVPLTARGRTHGALTLISAESGRHYDEADQAFAQDLARRAAVALDNARLFAEASSRAVSAGFAAADPSSGSADGGGHDELARVLESMTDGFIRLDRSWRFRYVNAQAERLLFRRRDELLGHDVWERYPEAVGPEWSENYERAMSTGQQVNFEAFFATLDSWFEVRASPDAEGLSVFFHDITARKRAELAREAAHARLEVLAEAARAFVGTAEPAEVVDRVAAVLVPGFAEGAVVALVDDAGRPRPSATSPLLTAVAERLVDSAVVAGVAATAEGSCLASLDVVGPRPGPSAEELLHEAGMRSALVVPLHTGARVLGVVVLARSAARPPFAGPDLETGADIGRRAALALENAELYARQRRAAEVLQRSLLTPLPAPEGLPLAARYRPAAQEAQVGGDWYDAFVQPDGATVLVIGDVIGHDISAAAAMGQLRNLLRGSAFDRHESPAQVLRRVDAAMSGLHVDTLASALVVQVDPAPDGEPRRLRWSSAGHPPAMLLRPDGRVDVLDGSDLLLGLDPGTERQDRDVTAGPGSTLVLYTDGLVERRDRDLGDGLTRLHAALEGLAGAALGDLCDGLLAELLPEASDDDVAVLVVRLAPDAARVDRPAVRVDPDAVPGSASVPGVPVPTQTGGPVQPPTGSRTS